MSSSITSRARHVEEEAGGRVRRARQEGTRRARRLRQPRGDLGARAADEMNTSDHMPGAGNSTSADLAEARAGLREQRLEDLLHGLVDRPHDRHAVEQVLAELDQRAADQVGGEEAEQRQRDERDDQAGARDAERQIGLGPVGRRNERPHQLVDPVDEPPGQTDGDVERPDQDQAGQEIIAQPRRPTLWCERRQRCAAAGGDRSFGR